ncbi:MAG: hypothetical protein QM768_14305 [Agriterribacter sp.]
MKYIFLTLFALQSFSIFAQRSSSLPEQAWVDSIFATLSENEKIAQLMVVRVSSISNGKVTFYGDEVKNAINTYNIGGICLFQGGPADRQII